MNAPRVSIFPLIALLAVWNTACQVNGQDLHVVVPAISGYSNSRPANFNWSFQSAAGGQVRMGQFACGSWWVAPADGDTGITVVSLVGKTDDPSWHDLLSLDADPITESMGLLSPDKDYGNYNAAENLLPDLPVTFTPPGGSCISLVAAMQRNEDETSKGGTSAIVGNVADAYCVITLMPEPPPNDGQDMIRPNITGATKEFLTWDDFDLNRIPSYSFLSGRTASSWDNTAIRWSFDTEIFGIATEHDQWGTTRYSEGGRAFRAANLVSNYAAGMTSAFNSDVLALFSSSTDIEVAKPALAAMLSFGLDIYHCRYDNGTARRKAWSSGAGQSGGQFVPPVFLASLLKDETKANVLRKTAITNHGNDIMELGPQELRQPTRGVTGVLLWGDGTPFIRPGNAMVEFDWRAWGELKGSGCYDGSVLECNPNTGKKTVADPYGYIDGPIGLPGSNYMSVSFGGVRGMAAIMILMPRFRWVVNTDDPIEYADRIVRHGVWTAPDPVAPPTETDQLNGCPIYWSAGDCVDFGILYGPVLSDVRFAIEDGRGRFTSRDGNPESGGYESAQARDNWFTIIGMYNGERYENHAVPLGTLVSPEILFETGDAPTAHILSPNPEAIIHYTLDGTDPTEASEVYFAPVPVSVGTEVRARAYPGPVNEDVMSMTLYPVKEPSSIRGRTLVLFGQLDTTAPSTPSDLTILSTTSTTIDVSWSEATDDVGVDHYNLIVNETTVPLKETRFLLTGLSPFSLYRISVRAVDTSGNYSGASTILTVLTKPATDLKERWGDGMADSNGDVDTQTNLGWLRLTASDWAWSFSLHKWIYAPDPGIDPFGFWLYVPN